MISRLKRGVFIVLFSLIFLTGIAGAQTDGTTWPKPPKEDLFEGFVYYSDAGKTALKSVKRNFSSLLDDHQLGLEILQAVISGPPDARLHPTWPADTGVNALFITDEGTAFVDLEFNNTTGDPAGRLMDTTSELLAVYAVVNSLALNISKIKQVKILIRGKDARTLAGHIGLEHFYKANMLIVK